MRVRVPGEIQPWARPPFPVVRGREQSVDDFLVSLWAFVSEKGVYFLERRWKSDEIEAQATDPGLFRGFHRRGEPFLLEPGEDEPVDGVSDPRRVAHLRKIGTPGLHVGPMFRRWGCLRRGEIAGRDPLANESDRFLGKGFGAERHRRLVESEKTSQDRAVLRVPRNDGGSSLSSTQDGGLGVEAELAFLNLGTVARGARRLEDGQDVALE